VARAGLGVALVQRRMAAPFLASGALALLHPAEMPMPVPYVAVLPAARGRRPDVQALVAHLKAKAAQAG
jgi:DNA-binding transcriptional LysR family regulator